MAAADQIAPERRRFAIQMPRPLSIGVAAGVMVVALGLHIGLPIYRQQVAIRDIERLGGEVTTNPGGPKWLRQWVGSELMKPLDRAHGVYLDSRLATDAMLREASWLTGLSGLTLSNTQVTDTGMIHVKRMKNMHVLIVHNARVSDAGLVHLKDLPKLRGLGLSGTNVTDAGMAHLNGLTKLERLSLDNTQVTDAGLVQLKGHSTLKWLGVKDTHVTSAGCDDLKRALPRVTIERQWPR